MKNATILLLTLALGITSCNVTYDKPKPDYLKEVTVVDVQTGDTIIISLPLNQGIPTTAQKK